MRKTFKKFWLKSEKEEAVENSIPEEKVSPVDKAMNNLIKMKEATKLLKALGQLIPALRIILQQDMLQ